VCVCVCVCVRVRVRVCVCVFCIIVILLIGLEVTRNILRSVRAIFIAFNRKKQLSKCSDWIIFLDIEE